MVLGHQQTNKENTGSDARQELLSKLLGSGVLNSVKAHLRAKLFAELKGRDLNTALAPQPSPTLQQHVLNCVVTEYLLRQEYPYTLSVFLAESGTHKLPQLSHADLLRLSVEARVAECQRDCESRYAAQLQSALSKLRDEEIQAVRDAEAAKASHQLAADRVALKQSFQERVDKLQLQEEELLEKARKAQRVLDQLREEHDIKLQAEEERLRSWKEQEEAALAAKAVEARRRLELADRQQQQAQELQREAEQRLLEQQATVQRDLQRREDYLRQQQAVLDMEREQLGRSRAHLAATEAEGDQLRRQLASQTDLYIKEKMYLQQEVQQLQSQLQLLQPELIRLRQQEAKGQQGDKQDAEGPPSERGQQLHQALHTLQQHQAQAQQELLACRAREQLWRESASTNDRLLDKAGKWHEQCLQHAEELKLALAAAVREVAHLQQQAQLGRRAAAINPSAAVPAVVLGAGAGTNVAPAGDAETGIVACRGAAHSEEENGEDIETASLVASRSPYPSSQQAQSPGVLERNGLHVERQKIHEASEPVVGAAAEEPSAFYLSDSEDSKF
ncbi:hypothetical protein N2152v2_003991 [Parachlorella kessleri]